MLCSSKYIKCNYKTSTVHVYKFFIMQNDTIVQVLSFSSVKKGPKGYK